MERQKERTWIKKTSFILKHYGIYVFEYEMDRDVFTLLNGNFAVIREIPGFLDYLETTPRIHQKDRRAAGRSFRHEALTP